MNITLKKLHSLVFLCLFSLCATTLFAPLDSDGAPEEFDTPSAAITRIKELKDTGDTTSEFVIIRTRKVGANEDKFTAIKVGAEGYEGIQVHKDPENSDALYIHNPKTNTSEWFDNSNGHVHVSPEDDLSSSDARSAKTRPLQSATPMQLDTARQPASGPASGPTVISRASAAADSPLGRSGSSTISTVVSPGEVSAQLGSTRLFRSTSDETDEGLSEGEESPLRSAAVSPVEDLDPRLAAKRGTRAREQGIPPASSFDFRHEQPGKTQRTGLLPSPVLPNGKVVLPPTGNSSRKATLHDAAFSGSEYSPRDQAGSGSGGSGLFTGMEVASPSAVLAQSRSVSRGDAPVVAVLSDAKMARTATLTKQLQAKIDTLNAQINEEEATAEKETRWLPGKKDAKLRAEARKASLETQLASLQELQKLLKDPGATPTQVARAMSAVHIAGADEEARSIATELFRERRKKAKIRSDESFPTTLAMTKEREELDRLAKQNVEAQFRDLAARDDMVDYCKRQLAKHTEIAKAFSRFQAAMAGMEAAGARKTDDVEARLTELRQTQAVLQATLQQLRKRISDSTITKEQQKLEQEAQQLLGAHLQLRNADLQKRIDDLEKFKAEKSISKKDKKRRAELANAGFEVKVDAPVAAPVAKETPRPQARATAASPLSRTRRDGVDSRDSFEQEDDGMLKPAIVLDTRIRRGASRLAGGDAKPSREPVDGKRTAALPRRGDAIRASSRADESRHEAAAEEKRKAAPRDDSRRSEDPRERDLQAQRALREEYERNVARLRKEAASHRGSSGRTDDTRLSQFTADSTAAGSRSRSSSPEPARPQASAVKPLRLKPGASYRSQAISGNSRSAVHREREESARRHREDAAQARKRI